MGVDKTRTRTGGLGLADSDWQMRTGGLGLADADWRTRTRTGGRGLADRQKNRKIFKKKNFKR